MNEATTSKLAEDFKLLKNDLGALVKTTGTVVAELRQPIEAKIAAARKALAERRAARLHQPDEAQKKPASFALDSAWVAVGIATAIGVALGLLLRRRS